MINLPPWSSSCLYGDNSCECAMMVLAIPMPIIMGKIVTWYVSFLFACTVTGPGDRCPAVLFMRSLWTSVILFNCTIIWNPVTEESLE